MENLSNLEELNCTVLYCISLWRRNPMQVRVNLVPESARHLQMTRTRQMRVICVRVRVIYLRPFWGPEKHKVAIFWFVSLLYNRLDMKTSFHSCASSEGKSPPRGRRCSAVNAITAFLSWQYRSGPSVSVSQECEAKLWIQRQSKEEIWRSD